MKSKTSAILITGAMLSATVLPVQADPMLDLLKVLRDKGTISTEDYNIIADAAKAQEEKMDKMVATAKPATSWADTVVWSGDVRYRYEGIDDDRRDDERNRNRLRARIGVTAQVTDTVKAGVALASGSDDPVSSNQTLGGGGSSKGINLDMGWIDWNFAENMNLVAGKTKNPFYAPAKHGLVWDGDYRPEGGHLSYDNGTIWAIAAYHFLNSDNGSNGTNDVEEMFGAQLGFNGSISDTTSYKIGASYFYIPVEGSASFVDGDFFGNSSIGGLHALDYEIAEVFAELNTNLGGIPTTLFADFVQNTDSDADEDTGYALGVKLGKVKNKGDWDFGYAYQDLEADAVFAAFTDSDFGGGGTDVKGHKFSAGLGLSKNTKLGLTYFKNEYGDFTRGEEFDYDRIQLDLSTKF
tara:strand:+ start:1914 stop:3140 length:1227 start_codon:yes stop_codon:yes gene_type:complete